MPVVTSNTDSTAQRVCQKFTRMQSHRVNWEPHWRELAEFIMPKKDDVYMSKIPGEKKGNRLYTGMPIHANEELAATLHGTLTNPATEWFGMSTGDKRLDEMPSVKTWLQHVTTRMIDVMNQSNFQTQIHEVYLDLGCFGTSLMLIEEDEERTVNFLSRPIYMAYIEESHKGIVDTVAFRRMRTLRQIVQEFGEDVLDDELKGQLETNPEAEFHVIHMVEPREDYNPKMKDKKNKPFASTHILEEKKITLKESGFDEMPYTVARWSKIAGEVYGRSPAMKALPDVKMLNAMKKAVIQGAQKVVNPPMQAPDDGVLLPLKTGPGDINYFRAGTRDRIEPILTGARPDLGEAIIRDVETDIRAAFFLDKTQIRQGDRMTTVEVRQRIDEQLRTLSPLLGRQEFELLRPLIDRVFNVMTRKNMFDPAPEILADKELNVIYTSQIAKAQRTANADDVTRVINIIAPLAQAQPQVIDNFNSDDIVRDLSNQFNLPGAYLNKPSDVKKIRAGRAQAQQQQKELEDANSAVELAGKASQLGE